MPDAGPDAGLAHGIHPASILVATDLSDLDRLMPFALQQAHETGARLILLHVIASAAAISVDAAGMPYYDPSGTLESAAKALQPWCERARRQDAVCDAMVREGHPAQQIAAAASQFQADRVLLGTRSRSKLGKLLLGSVAEQVLRSVNLPVITVGPEAHLAAETDDREKVVLYATTLREASRPSAALAFRIAASLGAKLVLLHVLPPPEGPLLVEPILAEPILAEPKREKLTMDEPDRQGPGRSGQPASLDSAAWRELRILAAEIGSHCRTPVEPHLVHGNPLIEILAEAAERRASLIVLGARPRSTFENLTRDRTIYRVLAHARCPVLTLREPQPNPAAAEAPSLAVHL